jgi:hypothetical protein
MQYEWTDIESLIVVTKLDVLSARRVICYGTERMQAVGASIEFDRETTSSTRFR